MPGLGPGGEPDPEFLGPSRIASLAPQNEVERFGQDKTLLILTKVRTQSFFGLGPSRLVSLAPQDEEWMLLLPQLFPPQKATTG